MVASSTSLKELIYSDAEIISKEELQFQLQLHLHCIVSQLHYTCKLQHTEVNAKYILLQSEKFTNTMKTA